MPSRKVLQPFIAQVAPLEASPVHPTIQTLRKMWKFAAICQFLFVFDEAFGMSGFESEALENDLQGTETDFISDLIKRLLYTLTLDRRIDLFNWQEHLRKQYLLRDPEANKLGTIQTPIHWHQLQLQDKVNALHDLCEWQLHDPERFRKLVKSEEDTAAWRVAPIGWDAQDNAFWLFDDNRIWIQRPEPLPPSSEKPKPPVKKGSKRARMEAAAAKRAAKVAAVSSLSSSSSSRPSTPISSNDKKRGRTLQETPQLTPSKRTRTTTASNNSVKSTPSRLPPRRGTRSSARFSHLDQDEQNPDATGDDRENIPSELLITAETRSNGGAQGRRNSNSSDSDLSEPPDPSEAETAADDKVKTEDGTESSLTDRNQQDSKDGGGGGQVESNHMIKPETLVEPNGNENEVQDQDSVSGWIEFECIVVTRQDWLDFSQKFAKSKDPNERNLHTFVNNEILPTILANFDEIERQKALELALTNRKRSSRIAIKESEREEKERDREARARMEDKMTRLRQEEEERTSKEEEERRAQKAREDRVREREERLVAREREIVERAVREEQERERREKEREERVRRRDEIIANGGVPPSRDASPIAETLPTDTKSQEQDPQPMDVDHQEETWELNCEVCGKAGINPPNEDKEIVCCESCSIWQHVKCWNKFDKHVLDRKKNRNWANEDFFCTKCKPPAEGVPRPTPGMIFRKEKSSPSVASIGRNSLDPETATKQASRPVAHSSPLEYNKLQLEATPHLAMSSNSSLPLPPPLLGAKPAETGSLVSAGSTMPGSVSAVTVMATALPHAATPSSYPLPDAHSDRITHGHPLLPNSSSSSSLSSPSGAEAKHVMLPPAPGRIVSSQPPVNQLTSPGSYQSNGSPISSPNSRSPSIGIGMVVSPQQWRRPSVPSGSFPMRHMVAKSPLSKPPSMNEPVVTLTLGPSRAPSPTPIRSPLSQSLTGLSQSIQQHLANEKS